MKQVVVDDKAAAALGAAFSWVYANQIIDKKRFIPGELVEVVDKKGRFLGIGYINPNSVIAIRILTFNRESIDEDFFRKRFEAAMRLRSHIPSDAYRIIHSEADMLPGLVMDRYGDLMSLHITTLGMLKFKDLVVSLAQELFAPTAMVVVAQEKMAKKEGFEPFVERIGTIEPKIITEHGVKFEVDVLAAQKTGFYLDQRANRAIVSEYVPKKGRVLDCFSNSGGFGLYCAVKKSAEVTLVDISQTAMDQARRNFELNGVQAQFVVANVFDYLRQIRSKERFDMVILDPPSFAKSTRQKSGALRGFKDIAVNGMKVVADGGYLALFSCSHHVGLEDLVQIMRKAAADNRKRLVVVEHLFQDKDHPIVLNFPPSSYLTGLLCQVFGV